MESRDVKLIEAFKADDKEAFNKLVIKYKDMVFNLCYRLLNNYDEADDCAQETFIKVYRGLRKFKFQSAFKTWLYRITINTCKNRIASLEFRTKKKMIRLDKEICSDNKSLKLEIADNQHSPEKKFEKSETERIVQEAINMLPKRQRIMIVLRDIEGNSYEEIVKITGFKIGTVKSKIARARQQLKNYLEEVL